MAARSFCSSSFIAKEEPENESNALAARIVGNKIFEVERITVLLQTPKGNARIVEIGWIQDALHIGDHATFFQFRQDFRCRLRFVLAVSYRQDNRGCLGEVFP